MKGFSKFWKVSVIVLFVVIGVGLFQKAGAQSKRVLQLSGIILGEDSTSGLPGVHIYVPKRQDGVTSNYLGFFSLPVLIGDSIVFSAVGYTKQHFIVPDSLNKQATLIVEMVSDTTYLKNVTIMPFPTEEVFKDAVLALNLPPDDEIDSDNLNRELLTLMMRSAPMSPEVNYRFYMDEMINTQTYRYSQRPNPFLNPFNWAKFIRSLKER
ncbi:MAG: carboxypeptidase-like regulatory domain-containing protein [Cyclobacteriaceae bacterium]|nr:carboxypeptidase-like regulatory domain-containing protein [Cyclobacteriaceae bacterium]